MKPLIRIVIICLALSGSNGLRCFSCDNTASLVQTDSDVADDCLKQPANVPNASRECRDPRHNLCYTRKTVTSYNGLEKIQLIRGCCQKGDSICPEGQGNLYEQEYSYGDGDSIEIKVVTVMCGDDDDDDDDLCNVYNGSEEEGVEGGGGVIVVSGARPEEDEDDDEMGSGAARAAHGGLWLLAAPIAAALILTM